MLWQGRKDRGDGQEEKIRDDSGVENWKVLLEGCGLEELRREKERQLGMSQMEEEIVRLKDMTRRKGGRGSVIECS